MYERKHQPLLSKLQFYRRLLWHVGIAMVAAVVSLVIGMAGYMVTEHMSWVDAFLNVSMLLGGMGPVNPPQTTAGKLFAGVFALYAGLLFIVSAALVMTPAVHRVLHHFHLNDKD